MAAIDVHDVEAWPAYHRARYQLSRVQDITGRVCTAAGAVVAGIGMLVPAVAGPGLAAAAAATAAGLVTLRAWRPDGVTRATASAMYAMPGAGLCGLLAWEALAAAPHWGMAAGLLTWVTGTWAVRPAQAARRMLAGPPPAPAVPAPASAEVIPVDEQDAAARWWAENVAVGGGAAPGTVLREAEPYGDGVRAIVASAQPGAVPEIRTAALSALLDVPEDAIRVTPVPGRGAGMRMITIGYGGDEEMTPAEVWRTQIAPAAMPNSRLVEVRQGTGDRADVVELHVEVPRGHVLTYDALALASALDCEEDPTRVAVEAHIRRAIVTVYPRNPLAQVRPATRDDLVMDSRGYITVGVYHNGRAARRRMFDPETGSAQRFLLFGTTGAGKSRALQLQLAAEKVNGVVTWLADLKEGQSVPEAAGNVDWRVTSQEGAIAMLRAAVAVAHARMRRYSAIGQNAFVLGGPDPLLHLHIDEANRLVEDGAPYRKEAIRLIKELARTGRSVGVGIGLAAQASHLDELGGSDTARGLLKEGEVTLLRWSSSMMRQLVTDGLLPPGVQLAPIPKRIGAPVLVSQFDEDGDEEEGEGTQGMAYLLSSPHPTSLMRHFRVGSAEPLPGLDPQILDLYGPEPPTTLGPEDAAAAGEAYALRHDEEALAALFDAEQAQHTSKMDIPTADTADGVEPTRTPPRLLPDRVLAVLQAAEGSLSVSDIHAAVNADGGPQVKLGSIRNALSSLRQDELVLQKGRGEYEAVR